MLSRTHGPPSESVTLRDECTAGCPKQEGPQKHLSRAAAEGQLGRAGQQQAGRNGPSTLDSSHTLARLPSTLGGRHSAGSRESVPNLRLVGDQMQPSAPGPGKLGPTG